jgi:hypothetical protein
MNDPKLTPLLYYVSDYGHEGGSGNSSNFDDGLWMSFVIQTMDIKSSL